MTAGIDGEVLVEQKMCGRGRVEAPGEEYDSAGEREREI